MDSIPAILRLPDELLLNIFNVFIHDRTDFNNLNGHQWPRTILRLCLTCKHFNRLATPLLLYRWSNLNRYDTWWPLSELVKHLAKHPEDRKAVRELAVASLLDEEPEFGLSKDETPVEYPEFGNDISTYLIHANEYDSKDRTNSISVALTAALMRMLPRLEELEISWSAAHDLLSDFFFSLNPNNQGLFESQNSCCFLRKLIVSPGGDVHSVRLSLLSQFLFLPSLRAFYGYNNVVDLGCDEANYRKSPVEVVAFMNSDVGSVQVANTLNNFTTLRKIIIVLDGYCGQSSFTCSAIAHAVAVHEQTLEQLTINIAWSALTHNDDEDPGDDGGILGKQGTFPNLWMLSIGLEVIFGRSEQEEPRSLLGRLPESLKELQINNDDIVNTTEEICLMLKELLRHSNGPKKRYSKLSVLDITEWGSIFSTADKENRKVLEEACSHAGVEIQPKRSTNTRLFGWVKNND
jgi:F-box-like